MRNNVIDRFYTALHTNKAKRGRAPDRWIVSPAVWTEWKREIAVAEDGSDLVPMPISEADYIDKPQCLGIPVEKRHGITGINAEYDDE